MFPMTEIQPDTHELAMARQDLKLAQEMLHLTELELPKAKARVDYWLKKVQELEAHHA